MEVIVRVELEYLPRLPTYLTYVSTIMNLGGSEEES